ncbi:hypothetical protein [uncultured Tenacibaculum sp.]|uniref:hypothetical protein n=1 Tax=uncultured Tenacibaculum sp. TaxID=174713 RepID=UPI002632DFF2|nr:hypothetical protein [uncultured Tenacibaculum sp.]
MKVFYNYIVLALSILIIGCNTNEELVETKQDLETKASVLLKEFPSEIININHKYDYYGKEFQVTYVFNNETQEIVDAYGDQEIAIEVFGRGEEGPQGTLVTGVVEKGNYKEIKMKIFNTAKEIDAFTAEELRETKEVVKGELASRNNCINVDLPGNDEIRFFEDINYVYELSNIRGLNKRTYGKQYLGHNNDRISSFYMRSNSFQQVSFYEHSCYTGKRLTFNKYQGSNFYGESNLRHHTLSGTWFWKVSWNDKISSFWMP